MLLSRRDKSSVAWHGVPGKGHYGSVPLGYGLKRYDPLSQKHRARGD
jgi:hypothetical protein